MGKTIYLECLNGISADMTVAALLDLGADWDKLKRTLGTIGELGFTVEKKQVLKMGISCVDFQVNLDKEYDNHDADMEFLFGHEHAFLHTKESDFTKLPMHQGHSHIHRGLAEVYEIIDSCGMTDRAKKLAKSIFLILGKAEAKAHATTLEEVHFHEVGAVDSIVDVISAAVCLDDLDVTKVYISELNEGRGTIRCQHGILPIPVPAVANILEEYPLTVSFTDRRAELITPTGAAIAAAVMTEEKLPAHFEIRKIGYGAGKRKYEIPSILRAMWISEGADTAKKEKEEKETFFAALEHDSIYKIETNIDDSTGEMLGHVMDRLFMVGALDVTYHPIYMKKNRPSWQITVICRKDCVEKIEYLLFHETTTIGVRRTQMERDILPRECREIETTLGKVQVKICDLGDEKRLYPEYESIALASKENGLSFFETARRIRAEIER